MKKIIGLSCGRKNGNSETLLRAAAMGAQELGVETEIIRAMSLKVLPCTGCQACGKTHKCTLKDDVDWILEKTCLEDCGLILSVPCYHIRPNGYFLCIHERMNHIFDKDMDILKRNRVGGIIGIGGGGYDAWTSLTLPLVNIFLQHTRVLVDQFQVNYCGLKEWNTWMEDTNVTAEHINELRVQDLGYDDLMQKWPQPYSLIQIFEKSIERARQLGRNVARAMSLPIEEVKYQGDDPEVACPVCHSNIVVIPQALPYVACPVCYVRGTATVKDGKMTVAWNMEDAEHPRFSYEAVKHHLEWLGRHYGQNYSRQDQLKQLAKGLEPYGTIIKPEKS